MLYFWHWLFLTLFSRSLQSIFCKTLCSKIVVFKCAPKIRLTCQVPVIISLLAVEKMWKIWLALCLRSPREDRESHYWWTDQTKLSLLEYQLEKPHFSRLITSAFVFTVRSRITSRRPTTNKLDWYFHGYSSNTKIFNHYPLICKILETYTRCSSVSWEITVSQTNVYFCGKNTGYSMKQYVSQQFAVIFSFKST